MVLASRVGISATELERSLEEELEMSDWLDANVEAITEAYLLHQEREAA